MTNQGESYYRYAAIRAILREMHVDPDRPSAKDLRKARETFHKQTQVSRNIFGSDFKNAYYSKME